MENLAEIVAKLDTLQNDIQPYRPLKPEQLQRLMQKLRLDWNYHSNHIEGNSLTYGETRTLLLYGTTAKGKPLKDHLEIQGHNEAVEWIMDLLRGKEMERPLSETFIRELHKLILKEPYYKDAVTAEGLPTKKLIQIGQYKTEPNHVITPTGEMFYYASPEETQAKMGDLMAWYETETKKKELHPLAIAIGFHYRFVRIHPFDDGNGRMARLLMNFILMKYGYPPAIIPTEQRKDYIDALREADETENLEPFAVYVGKCLVQSLDLMLKVARGESIEEPDDFDKKIKLLQARIKGEDKIELVKTKELTQELLYDVIIPKIQFFVINQKIKGLLKLFVSSNFDISFLYEAIYYQPSRRKEIINFIISENIEIDIIQTELKQRLQFDIFQDITFIFKLNDFKSMNSLFSLNTTIRIDFGNTKYFIECGVEDSHKHFIEKLYHQVPTEAEWEEIANFIGDGLLAEIEKRISQ